MVTASLLGSYPLRQARCAMTCNKNVSSWTCIKVLLPTKRQKGVDGLVPHGSTHATSILDPRDLFFNLFAASHWAWHGLAQCEPSFCSLCSFDSWRSLAQHPPSRLLGPGKSFQLSKPSKPRPSRYNLLQEVNKAGNGLRSDDFLNFEWNHLWATFEKVSGNCLTSNTGGKCICFLCGIVLKARWESKCTPRTFLMHAMRIKCNVM